MFVMFSIFRQGPESTVCTSRHLNEMYILVSATECASLRPNLSTTVNLHNIYIYIYIYIYIHMRSCCPSPRSSLMISHNTSYVCSSSPSQTLSCDIRCSVTMGPQFHKFRMKTTDIASLFSIPNDLTGDNRPKIPPYHYGVLKYLKTLP